MKIQVDPKKASKRDVVRNLDQLQKDYNALWGEYNRVKLHIDRRLRDFPYKLVNRVWPFFPKKKPKTINR